MTTKDRASEQAEAQAVALAARLEDGPFYRSSQYVRQAAALIRAQAAENARLKKQRDAAETTVQTYMAANHTNLAENAQLKVAEAAVRKNRRATFEAMCAMRDSINEHVPMPSLESDLLQGPEDSVFCATVAEAVVSALAATKTERDILRDTVEGLRADLADVVEVAFKRGATDYVRLNYPAQYATLAGKK